MKLIIVSGLSGSGKSVALGTLEDLGYYCIDNLPAGLLPDFAKQMLRLDGGATSRLSAVAIDARNMVQDIRDFSNVLEKIRQLKVPVEILFLDAEKATLIRRFSETRRRHPLTNDKTSLAEAIDEEASLLSVISEFADLRIDTFRASGAGGQHVNKTDSAIRITHVPSGVVVECQDQRSQHKNRAQAMSVLQARLQQAEDEKRRSEEESSRRNLVASGDRSERIRTYNFPQGRMSDHRINLTLYRLNEIMEGNLQLVMEPIMQENQADLLAALADNN